MRITAKDAETRFAEILQCVRDGEAVTIVEDGQDIANLSPAPPPKLTNEEIIARRKAIRGSLKGKIWMADDFDAPLPDDMLKRLYGE